MAAENPTFKSTKAKVEELRKKRGDGRSFKPSGLSEEERKEYNNLSRRLKIKARNSGK